MIREDVVNQLVATKKWSEPTARLAERSNYKCEYCDLDLLGSIEAYKLFEVDHIIPLSKNGGNEFDNLAIACRNCNFHLKRAWNPSDNVGDSASRDILILAARTYIEQTKKEREADLEIVRRIVGWSYR